MRLDRARAEHELFADFTVRRPAATNSAILRSLAVSALRPAWVAARTTWWPSRRSSRVASLRSRSAPSRRTPASASISASRAASRSPAAASAWPSASLRGREERTAGASRCAPRPTPSSARCWRQHAPRAMPRTGAWGLGARCSAASASAQARCASIRSAVAAGRSTAECSRNASTNWSRPAPGCGGDERDAEAPSRVAPRRGSPRVPLAAASPACCRAAPTSPAVSRADASAHCAHSRIRALPARRARSTPSSAAAVASAIRPSSTSVATDSIARITSTRSRPVAPRLGTAPEVGERRVELAEPAARAPLHPERGETSRELGRGEPLQRGARLVEAPRRPGPARRNGCERPAGQGGDLERRLADRASVVARVGGLGERLVEVAGQQPGQAKREPQPDPIRGRLSRQIDERHMEAAAPFFVPAEPPLHVGQRDREPQAIGGTRSGQCAAQGRPGSGGIAGAAWARPGAVASRSVARVGRRAAAAVRQRGTARRSRGPTPGARWRRTEQRDRASSPGRAACSTWCASVTAPAPRRSSSAAARACAPSRHPPPAAR